MYQICTVGLPLHLIPCVVMRALDVEVDASHMVGGGLWNKLDLEF
jgi:hypothetical protein